MNSFIIVHGYRLSKRTPQGRADKNFETQSLLKLREIAELAVKNKAALVFTTDWLSTITDEAAFDAVSILRPVRKIYMSQGFSTSEQALNALSIQCIDNGIAEKSLRLSASPNGLTLREKDAGVSVVYARLPVAIGSGDNNAVTLVRLPTGRSKSTESKIERLPLAYDAFEASSTNTCAAPVIHSPLADSEFVEKLTAHLGKKPTSDEQEKGPKEALSDILEQTNMDADFSEYMSGLF